MNYQFDDTFQQFKVFLSVVSAINLKFYDFYVFFYFCLLFYFYDVLIYNLCFFDTNAFHDYQTSTTARVRYRRTC